MLGAAGLRSERESASDGDLFTAVGAFLLAHRLAPDPVNYAFAHSVVADPSSTLAAAVARLTDGGIRLTSRDVAALGARVVSGAPVEDVRRPDSDEQLIGRASEQVASFASMVKAMHDETRGFGDHLAQSAAAIQNTAGAAPLAEIARVTGAMVQRIRESEARLAAATAEAETLRGALHEARETARRDPLTGLPNRRALEEALAKPGPGVRWLGLCDIDHFKRINDGFGHGVGDRVLSAIAAALATACGEHLVVRYGGEEFAVLIVGGTRAQAGALLETARQAIAAKRFRSRDTGELIGAITFSAGLIRLSPDEDVDAALHRADGLLYDAKAQGRDRIVLE